MRFFSFLIVSCLSLLTFGLCFIVDTLPALDRPTSFAALAFASFGALLLILTDGVRRAKSGKRVGGSYLALAFTMLLMTVNVLIWTIGEVTS